MEILKYYWALIKVAFYKPLTGAIFFTGLIAVFENKLMGYFANIPLTSSIADQLSQTPFWIFIILVAVRIFWAPYVIFNDKVCKHKNEIVELKKEINSSKEEFTSLKTKIAQSKEQYVLTFISVTENGSILLEKLRNPERANIKGIEEAKTIAFEWYEKSAVNNFKEYFPDLRSLFEQRMELENYPKRAKDDTSFQNLISMIDKAINEIKSIGRQILHTKGI